MLLNLFKLINYYLINSLFISRILSHKAKGGFITLVAETPQLSDSTLSTLMNSIAEQHLKSKQLLSSAVICRWKQG